MSETPTERPSSKATWEMELLISGATVFALMQLPAKLDQLLYDALNRTSLGLASLITPLWVYAKVAVVILIGTFLLHLFLRGYWVALVGLDSVYPGGIQAGKLKLGAIQARLVAEAPPMPERIARADQLATRVFGVGFGGAMAMLRPFAVALAVLLVAFIGKLTQVQELDLDLLGGAGLAIGLLPFVIVHWIDRARGSKLSPAGWVARVVRAIFRLYGKIGFGADSNPLVALFRSHESGSRAQTLASLAMVLVVLVSVGQSLFLAKGVALYSYDGLLPLEHPDTAQVLVPQHYASMRGETPATDPAPFIPDKIAQAPYLELNVPVRPNLLEAMRREPGCTDAGLECLVRLLDIHLDGAKVSVPLDASTDPATGLRTVMAMIPIANLAAGRHELTVAHPRIHDPDGPARPPERIPFWR
jgi:hypothetical protein